MKTIDYFDQEWPMRNLLQENGVQLKPGKVEELLETLKHSLTSSDCPKRTFPLGDWAVIVEGSDEYANLCEALGGWAR